MTIALRRTLTVDDYLAWAAAHPEARRTELINGQIVTMSPEQLRHDRLKKRIVNALEREIERTGIKAEAFTGGVTIAIEPHTACERTGRLSRQHLRPARCKSIRRVSPSSSRTRSADVRRSL